MNPDKNIELKSYLPDEESPKVVFKHQKRFLFSQKTTIVGKTSKRTFLFQKKGNIETFLSSQHPIDNCHFLKWRVPIWGWIFMIGVLIIPIIYLIFKEDPTLELTLILFIPYGLILIFFIIKNHFSSLSLKVANTPVILFSNKSDVIKQMVTFTQKIHFEKVLEAKSLSVVSRFSAMRSLKLKITIILLLVYLVPFIIFVFLAQEL